MSLSIHSLNRPDGNAAIEGTPDELIILLRYATDGADLTGAEALANTYEELEKHVVALIPDSPTWQRRVKEQQENGGKGG